MSMKYEKTDKTNELKLEFTIEAEKFDNAIKSVYSKSAKYFEVPGFRKGKAPFNIVVKNYGIEIFYEDAFNELVPPIFEEEIKANNIEAVSHPDIDIKQIGTGQDLIFTAIIQTKPEVKLGKYKGIEIKKIEYNVSDEDIQKELEAMADQNSRLVTVEDRPVKDGDTTIIDFEGFVDGVAFDGGKADDYELRIGSHSFIEGFEDQIIGMKIDEEKEINVKFPDEYFSPELAGKDAMFKVKLHEIKEKQMPEIDDELAKDVSEFDTLEELKADIKAKQEEENEKKAKFETEEEAIKAVSEQVEIEIPSGMIDTEVDNMIKSFEVRLSYQGLGLEQYLKFIGKTKTELRNEYKEEAKVNVKTKLVLSAIVEDAKIEVTEKEIEEKALEIGEKYGKKAEDVKTNQELLDSVKENMKLEKAIDYIVQNAKIK